ncbi:peptidoglycan DD-metalloendopeptidase family protein [Aquimarina sp. 2201CG14-23]|uniref:peptidoglycan DD-metalloendopeptidase family protein n=1 Tax=Aquimarina mycalae TaxID=3040073 RepID=UPI0024780910|nr:peptidoglycan DD-metalloendopeptidase family protein [Aquimarina sp. 2201CG14-23]MDH7444436.1 peptidoglycan DD-metalloendopeptidase family protein [Aquimarina sp. 2201CG14-23]
MTIHRFSQFIESISQDFIPVIDTGFLKEEYVAIDLSIHNNKLNAIDVSSSNEFEDYIEAYLISKRAKVAYGGYNETRAIYNRSVHFNQQDPETERNIHLGLDVWCDAETKVLAPLTGKVHSFQNNDNFGDYGPTIILEHIIKDVTFYTLYGHLSKESISTIEIGQRFVEGDVLAVLGDATVNGDYAPHLHFQIIKDMQGSMGDYPGVSNKRDLDFFLQNCPDPNLLLKI